MYMKRVIGLGVILASIGCLPEFEKHPAHYLPIFQLLAKISASDKGEGVQEGESIPNTPPTQMPQLSPPSFVPAPGQIQNLTNISFQFSPPDAIVYYTTDGSTPTMNSTTYTVPIQNVYALAGKMIQAIATKPGYLDSSVATGIYRYQPIRTGLTASYAAGDDGALQEGISRGYYDNGNGTVTDTATGLLWQKCSRGQNNDAICSGSATMDTWSASASYCSSLNLIGLSWRLPTILELSTLVFYGTSSSPVINNLLFPNTISDRYWSSTSSSNSTSSWRISFTFGLMATDTNSSNNYTRCVSGPIRDVDLNFTDLGDGTIRDNRTGLIWQKCSRGQNNDATCSGTATNDTWTNALSYCTNLNLAGRTWRLPNFNELLSLVDFQAHSPAISTTHFPNTVSGGYWTSTTRLANPANAWNINFTAGANGNSSKTMSSWAIRCVSGP